MRRPVLDVVASGVVQSLGDVARYVRCTLLCATQGFEVVKRATIEALWSLQADGFI